MARHSLDVLRLEENLCKAGAYMSVVARAEDAIIFVGTTKSGKSSLVNFLIGNKLIGKKQAFKIYIQKVDNSYGPQIGVTATSETTIPSKYHSNKLPGYALWDCPGFEDNRGFNQDICNAFYTYELFRIIKSAKIILVVNIATFQDDSMYAMRSLLRTIENLLKDKFKSSFPGIGMIVTKVDTFNGIKVTKESITEFFDDILLQNNIDISQHGQDLIRYLISNPQNIGLFKMAAEGPITDVIEDGIIEAINSLRAVPDYILKEISPSISEAAKVSLLEVREQLPLMQTFVELQKKVDNFLQEKLLHIENRQKEKLNDTELVEISTKLSGIKEWITRVLKNSISFERKINAFKMSDVQIEAYIDQKKLCEIAKCIEFVEKLLNTKDSLNFTLYIDNILTHAMQKVDELLVLTEFHKGKIKRDEANEEIAKLKEEHEKETRRMKCEMEALTKEIESYKNKLSCTIS